MRLQSVLVLALGVALASCSDSPTEPTVGASGSLSFTYTGAGAANATSYSASGAIPVNINNSFGSNSWAAGSVDQANGETAIAASVPRTANTWDLTVITIARTTTGTSNINAACTANVCTDVSIVFGSSQTETSFTYLCVLTSGSVTISAISSSNVTGTFSGTGTCSSATGAVTQFTITGGTFNVGVTTQL